MNSKKGNPEETSRGAIARVMKRILQSLTADDLRNLYSSLGLTPQIHVGASRTFVLNKIIQEASLKHLLKNEEFIIKIIDSYDKLSSSLEKILGDLTKDAINSICKELGQYEIAKTGAKSEIVQKVIAEIPFHKIWKSKIFQQKIKPRGATKADIRRIASAVKDLSTSVELLSQKYPQLLSHNRNVQQMLQQMMAKQEQLRQDMKILPDAGTFLEAFRKQSVALDKTLSQKELQAIIERVRDELHADPLSFMLKGLEIMLSHYLMKEVKSLRWEPDFQEFLRIVREEILKIQILPNQAEIPTLRDNVTQRLGIDELTFDDLLTEAWRRGRVSLHVGAPIDRKKVRYLKIGESQYFYVKLPR